MDCSILPNIEAAGGAFAPTAWAAQCMAAALQMQRAQLEAWAVWQRACAGFGQELLDEWVAHWGGGIPLDG